MSNSHLRRKVGQAEEEGGARETPHGLDRLLGVLGAPGGRAREAGLARWTR